MNQIDSAVSYLLFKGQPAESNSWQAISPLEEMFEVLDLFLQMPLCQSRDELMKMTKADLPWAEDHFQERLSGPSNPGREYKNWPYYRSEDDDPRFRFDGEFSHTYQERFWPPKQKGIRFEMGDYSDVVDRLNSDPPTRQAFLSIWHPEDQSNTPKRRLPCSIGYWFKKEGSRLNLTYLIRSCDAARHLRNDVYMAQRLAMVVANSVDLRVGRMSMWIGSLHYFKSDVYHLKKKLCQKL